MTHQIFHQKVQSCSMSFNFECRVFNLIYFKISTLYIDSNFSFKLQLKVLPQLRQYLPFNSYLIFLEWLFYRRRLKVKRYNKIPEFSKNWPLPHNATTVTLSKALKLKGHCSCTLCRKIVQKDFLGCAYLCFFVYSREQSIENKGQVLREIVYSFWVTWRGMEVH